MLSSKEECRFLLKELLIMQTRGMGRRFLAVGVEWEENDEDTATGKSIQDVQV